MARYIVNAGGILNSVNDEEFHLHMENARRTALQRTRTPDSALGAPDEQNVPMPREATADEVIAWWAAQGFVYDPATGEATPGKPAAKK